MAVLSAGLAARLALSTEQRAFPKRKLQGSGEGGGAGPPLTLEQMVV